MFRFFRERTYLRATHAVMHMPNGGARPCGDCVPERAHHDARGKAPHDENPGVVRARDALPVHAVELPAQALRAPHAGVPAALGYAHAQHAAHTGNAHRHRGRGGGPTYPYRHLLPPVHASSGSHGRKSGHAGRPWRAASQRGLGVTSSNFHHLRARAAAAPRAHKEV